MVKKRKAVGYTHVRLHSPTDANVNGKWVLLTDAEINRAYMRMKKKSGF